MCRISQIKLKLMFSPLGLREPTSKITHVSASAHATALPAKCGSLVTQLKIADKTLTPTTKLAG